MMSLVHLKYFPAGITVTYVTYPPYIKDACSSRTLDRRLGLHKQFSSIDAHNHSDDPVCLCVLPEPKERTRSFEEAASRNSESSGLDAIKLLSRERKSPMPKVSELIDSSSIQGDKRSLDALGRSGEAVRLSTELAGVVGCRSDCITVSRGSNLTRKDLLEFARLLFAFLFALMCAGGWVELVDGLLPVNWDELFGCRVLELDECFERLDDGEVPEVRDDLLWCIIPKFLPLSIK